MGLKLPNGTRPQDLQDPKFMGKVLLTSQTTVTDGTVTDESFADRGGNSVIGRPGGTPGKPSDIGLAPGQFLANRAGTLVGTTLVDTDIPTGIARDTEIAASVAAHNADINAHSELAQTAQFILACRVFN